VLLDGRQELIQQAALITDSAGTLMPNSGSAAATPPASLSASAFPATSAAESVPGTLLLPEVPVLDTATGAATASAGPVALRAAANEAGDVAGQTGSRRMLAGGQRRKVLQTQTCGPANPCLVSLGSTLVQ
jgi:hypothetical protein